MFLEQRLAQLEDPAASPEPPVAARGGSKRAQEIQPRDDVANYLEQVARAARTQR